uniref:Uncharacterized protein n=1 Tax=viral metagenome TaxID=1070528 RepID=A0A2V0R9I0_9ZZZZ
MMTTKPLQDSTTDDQLKVLENADSTQEGKGSSNHDDWDWRQFYGQYVPDECVVCGGGLTLAATIISDCYGQPWTVHSLCDGCDNQHVEEVDY